MIKIPIEDVIKKIVEQSGMSEKEVNEKIDAKMKAFDEIVSRDGAAFMVASENSVKVFEDPSTKVLQIKDVHPGMSGVELVAKVSRIFDARNFTRDGRDVPFISMIIKDETGDIRTTLWDKRSELISGNRLKVGDVIRIKNCSIRENSYTGKDLQMNSRSQIIINQDKLDVDIDAPVAAVETDLNNPTLGSPVTVFGTIVAVSEPRFYNACTECNRKVSESSECQTHGKVKTPRTTMILNFVLDDGKGNIRATCFGELGEKLIGEKADAMQDLIAAQGSENIGLNILGTMVKVSGIIKENKNYDRVEMNVNSVKIKNSEEMIARLNND